MNRRWSQGVLARRWRSLYRNGSEVTEHSGTASRAKVIGGRVERNRRHKASADQLSRTMNAVSTSAVGEKTVVANANKFRWKHVQQKAAEELVDMEIESLLGVPVGIVAITKGNARAVKREDSGVADGDTAALP